MNGTLSLKLLMLVASILLLPLAGYVGWGLMQRGPSESSLSLDTPRDLNDAMDLALESARTHPAIEFSPSRVTEADPERPYFADRAFEAFSEYYFLYVWSDLGHTENSPFAVSPDGAVFKLPEEFDQLTRDAALTLQDAGEAQVLLDFYLDFHALLPGTDRLVLLDDVTDIPGIDDEHVNRHRDRVRAVHVGPHADGWTFEFHTWRAAGGVLLRWLVDVSRAGEIDVQQREAVDDGLGESITIE